VASATLTCSRYRWLRSRRLRKNHQQLGGGHEISSIPVQNPCSIPCANQRSAMAMAMAMPRSSHPHESSNSASARSSNTTIKVSEPCARPAELGGSVDVTVRGGAGDLATRHRDHSVALAAPPAAVRKRSSSSTFPRLPHVAVLAASPSEKSRKLVSRCEGRARLEPKHCAVANDCVVRSVNYLSR
jgi:hypothetical protein